MKLALCSCSVVGCCAMPARLTRHSPCSPAGPGRNAMADSPQDFGGGLRPVVRSVQHQTLLMTRPTSPVAAPGSSENHKADFHAI